MSGIAVKADIRIRIPELDQVDRTLRRPRPLFRAAGVEIRKDVLRNFRLGGDYPEKWQPSKKAGGKTLIRTSVLRNSFHVKDRAWSVSVGTSVKYAAIHEFGGVIRPKRSGGMLRFVIGGVAIYRFKVRIPARPMIPVRNGRLRPQTEKRISDLFIRGMRKGT